VTWPVAGWSPRLSLARGAGKRCASDAHVPFVVAVVAPGRLALGHVLGYAVARASRDAPSVTDGHGYVHGLGWLHGVVAVFVSLTEVGDRRLAARALGDRRTPSPPLRHADNRVVDRIGPAIQVSKWMHK
jgi:hypothetical protein